jgi:lipopolysaccharide/colanic/teichoic acid biosynthesis glycosyltransferase
VTGARDVEPDGPFSYREQPEDPVLTFRSVDLSRTEAVFPSADDPIYEHHNSAYERYGKQVIDRVGGLILLIITLPFQAIIGMISWALMGRPVLLRQHRVGKKGKVFALYKFRTMAPDRRSNQVTFVGTDRRLTHKHPEDPRLTPFGRFLRTWSLDELPQFANVVIGDMSLVGPRPELVDIVARYEHWQHARHAVKPGVTCTWQISDRGDKPLHESTDVDLDYVKNITFWGDLRLLLLTPAAVLGIRRGH